MASTVKMNITEVLVGTSLLDFFSVNNFDFIKFSVLLKIMSSRRVLFKIMIQLLVVIKENVMNLKRNMQME